MKALIEPQQNNRIAQVESDEKVFPIAEPLYWIDCPDDCNTNWLFDNGNFIEPSTLLPPQLTDNEKLELIKIERDKRLTASDWTQFYDVVISHDEAWNKSWIDYRQTLRDLPDNITDIDNPIYPIPPA